MTTYYKAARPNGADFATGTIDYAAALVSGKQIHHPNYPARESRDDATYYLSVSTEPADCTGFSWPCRLFEVKPVKPWTPNRDDLPNKRACVSLKVVAELPAHLALGPNGEALVRFIEKCGTLTYEQGRAMGAAREAAWGAAWEAAWGAAWGLTARDLISPSHYDILTQPWVSVMGELS
jgi:hypothetical protein